MASVKTSIDETNEKGEFKRTDSVFRDWIENKEGAKFKAEPNRYVLYMSLACPWACRCNTVRVLKGLTSVIDIVVVEPVWGSISEEGKGWVLPPSEDQVITPGSTPDRYNGCVSIKQLYEKANPSYSGRYSVPVLWDLQLQTIVNNESSEIIRMFNKEFNEFAQHPEVNFLPAELESEIESRNTWMYNSINNGVYRCGFAQSQEAYETAFNELFKTLDEAEELLGRQRYVAGDRLTEADIRLFCTLIRFDAVYFGHFKCNRNRIEDFHNLSNWLREIYQTEGVRQTVDMNHIKQHYHRSQPAINPFGIVPVGPILDFDRPHDRASRFSQ